MIYTVHGYYGKSKSKKQHQKIEATVFAKDGNLAKAIVKDLFSDYPVEFEYLNVSGGIEKDLKKIYEQRPELRDIPPEVGYVYNELMHKQTIMRYFR